MINAVKEKWDTILILVTIVGTVLGMLHFAINPRLDALEASFGTKIESVESSLTSKIDSVESSLTAKINSVEAKFDNKFSSLANMMIVAHTNGEATREELIAIWERVGES